MQNFIKNHKNKFLILIFIIVIICLITTFLIITNNPIHLKEKTKTLEYGKTLSTNINDYIDTEQTNKDIVSDIKIDISKIKIEENKEYPAIGEYEIIFSYKDKEETLQLKVTDTTKPVFKDFKEEVKFTRDCKPSAEEFSKMYTAEDLDSVTITVDDSKVDYSKDGEYVATVKAIDGSKNEVTQDVKVVITAPTIKLDVSSKSKYVGESFVLEAKVVGKDDKVTFKSSDSSIASVDSNGKVSAKKKGSATITATANGVSAECKVTVKAKPSNSITTTTTVTNTQSGKKEEVTIVKPSTPSSSGGSGSSSSSSGGSVTMEYSLSKAKEAFNLQNAERAKVGAQQLQWNDTVYEACKVRAKEIVTNWSHTRPNGGRYTDLINGVAWSSAGENLAKGTTSASNAVASWMASPGHRANMLDGTFTHAAVAYYGGYWVTIFVQL